MNRFVPSVGGGAGSASEVRAAEGRSAGRWLTFLAAAWLASCGGRFDDGAALGGETHFLVTCGEGCGEGLSCIEGVCTRSCEPGFSSCSEFATRAECVSPSDNSAGLVPFGGRCDVLCASDLDCAPLGTGYACRSGACRAEPEDRGAELALGSKRAPLVRAIDDDTCRSGLLWVGGERSSAEMHPGSDCMGCHGQGSNRPLLLGGTVYPGGRASPQVLDDCFGIEGVQVIVTDADGRERSTVTNRAGNFYFEGRASELVMPYQASLRWDDFQGKEKLTPMGTAAAYGGCARCHNNLTLEEYGRQPYTPPLDSEDPERVSPAGSVIVLPGLYRE